MAERRLALARVPDEPRSLPRRYLTPLDVAELLGVPIETVY